MTVVEVDDPQPMIMLHFMTPLMAVQPVFESPLARPAALQRNMATQLLVDLLRDRPGAHGMLLVSIEQEGNFLVHYRSAIQCHSCLLLDCIALCPSFSPSATYSNFIY